MKSVKISVIVPIYNVESYLGECLDSLVNQTFDDFEVILVDDGSTDDSATIAQSYVDKYDYFSMIVKPNGGLSSARNAGVMKAVGKYIYFLDSDDYLVSTALEELINKAESAELDVLKFSAFSFEDGSSELYRDECYRYNGVYDRLYSGPEFIKAEIVNGDIYNVSCALVMIRKDLIDANGLRFVEGIIHEDIIYNWEMLSVASKVGVYDVPLYCRRYREGSITKTVDWYKRLEAMSKSIDEVYEFLAKHSEISESDNLWFLRFLAIKTTQYWVQMDKLSRRDLAIKSLLQKIQKQIRNHKGWHKLSLIIFSVNPYLYSIYHYLVDKVL